MMVSHEIGKGKAKVMIHPGSPMSDDELAHNLALPFVAEGGSWVLQERLEADDGTVTLHLVQEPGRPSLEHVEWLEQHGIKRRPRGKAQRRARMTGAQAKERAAAIEALEPEWRAEFDRHLRPLVAAARGWLRHE